MRVAARLRQVAGTKWGTRRYWTCTGYQKRVKQYERPQTFASPTGSRSTTTRSILTKMCEKLWTLPLTFAVG